MIDTVFFDRDGTLIADKHYLCDPGGVQPLPGAPEALAALAGAGCRLFLVSNQSGVGRGYFSEDACRACQERLAELLAMHDVVFTDMAYCPHTPGDACACRKPALGMWRAAQRTYGLAPERCAMVGDMKQDVAFGLAAGFAASILVLTGHGDAQARALGLPELPAGAAYIEFAERQPHWPHVLAADAVAAIAWILRAKERVNGRVA